MSKVIAPQGRKFTDNCTVGTAVNPPHLQILRVDREGMTDDVISHGIDHLCKKYSLILIDKAVHIN